MLFFSALTIGLLIALTAFPILLGVMLVDAFVIDFVDASSDWQRSLTSGIIVGASVPIAIGEFALILRAIDKRASQRLVRQPKD